MRVDIGDGVRLFFDVAGSSLRPTDEEMIDKPVLLLLHGGPGSDHSGFRPYFDRFADTHQVVYLDHRGNGRSDQRRDPSGWDLDTWADDVVRFCDALDIADPVVLGLSFGGFVAMRYGARHPDHASKIVLMSTAARSHPEESAQMFETLGGERARELYEHNFVRGEEYDTDYMTVNLPLYNRTPQTFGPRRTWQNLRVLERFTEGWAKEFDLDDDVRAFAVPTLVLGGADDPMTPPIASEEIFAALPDGLGRFEMLDDCGHGTFRDQPELTETILRDFLAE